MIADPATLDQILSVQLAIAWAGEGACEPRRLGWWATDLVDDAGGGDLLRRLIPRTAVWGGLEAVRVAARRADADARARLAAPHQARSIYFLGFDLDEALDERLAVHKHGTQSPAEALALPRGTFGAWTGTWLADAFGHVAAPPVKMTLAGRQVKTAVPDNPAVLVETLAACLVPPAETYPCPYFPL
ncbi:MAG TPA: BREX-6 system BrxE protein [Nannocystaceae bacterium]|nr:BREX-6 system BrxE protein [Nannocystaceae bacterium]